jgi:integrase
VSLRKKLRTGKSWPRFLSDNSRPRDRDDAVRLLRQRLKEVGACELDAKRKFLATNERSKTIADLVDSLESDYRRRDKASAQNLSNLRRVRADFGAIRAAELSDAHIEKYIDGLRNRGAANATVNRITQVLLQAYTYSGKFSLPRVPHLSEVDNVRQGFSDAAETQRIMAALPEYLRDYIFFAARVGMRKKESRSLRWPSVEGDRIRLKAIDAKTKEPRVIPMIGELSELLERRRIARAVTIDGITTLAEWVFHDGTGNFRESWIRACCRADVGHLLCRACELPVTRGLKCEKCGGTWSWSGNWKKLRYVGRLFHDFRRTAVRDMIRGGAPESAGMKISGHKTKAMLYRYDIVDDRDMRDALLAGEKYRDGQEQKVVAMTAPRPLGAQSGAQSAGGERTGS